MADPDMKPAAIPKSKSTTTLTSDSEPVMTPDDSTASPSRSHPDSSSPHDNAEETCAILPETPTLSATTPKSPRLSRNPSFSGSSSYQEDWEALPPLDRLTVLDLLDNFALPHQLELQLGKIQKGLSKSRQAIKARGQVARDRMVEEWRQRIPADEQLDRYRKRMRDSVEKLGRRWNDTKVVTAREKVSFICGVMNIFISGYLMGGLPEYMHWWYTLQIFYFLPIRYYTYHRRGYHYFLADLCYFVNFLLFLSIWFFPNSKRLFTAVYCLAFGNNAVAIVMWRNSLVFHSFDKVTSLFIHIMPCATLHCMVHLIDKELQEKMFPAVYLIRHSPPGSPTAYANVISMLSWSTIPYAVWQLSYYFFITVRRREKIAAGRPTSFTWLRKSYSKTWIGRIVLGLPDVLQEPAFMLIQYSYAVLTMLPCPIWFYSRYASASFLMFVFAWSVYNGATYYIDVFGKRFQKELEAMRAEVAKWQSHPDLGSSMGSPSMGPSHESADEAEDEALLSPEATKRGPRDSVNSISLLSGEAEILATGVDSSAKDVARERK
ncbi:hypothetical protein PspLS_05813 [Pyricularia sp. CBS 133598]|nr:hypothetical protein PspLS_05813 [Pyricularia sp. CBS 133598]